MSEDAIERRARALRENLRRRKQQARGREDAAPFAAVLAFWFAPPGDPAHGTFEKRWFDKDDAFDAECRKHFAPAVEAAIAGRYDDEATDARAVLALVILLDQFPRNLYRGTPHAFAGDARARLHADRAIAAGWDQVLAPVERNFLYLPFEHSETLADQERSVVLFAALPEASWRAEVVGYAEAHRDVIRRFGRFPHRNQALSRASTAEEAAYLATAGSGF
jgi:uncharacterized protein (DUF924 family)